MKTISTKELWPILEIVLEEAGEPVTSLDIVERLRLLGYEADIKHISVQLSHMYASKKRPRWFGRTRTPGPGNTRYHYFHLKHQPPVPAPQPVNPVNSEPVFDFHPVPEDLVGAGDGQVRAISVTVAGITIKIELTK